MNTEDFHQQIDALTQQIKATFGALSIEELNWKPNGKTWSIAQNMDHLIVINSTYFPLFEKVKKGELRLPFISNINFLVNYLGKFILQSVAPTNRKKIKTFPIWEPSQSEIPMDILQKFEAHQSQLKTYISQMKPFIKNGEIIHSPANKNIVYKLETAINIMITHEHRHFQQMQAVLELQKKN